MILVIIDQFLQKVLLCHEFLSSKPPVFYEFFRILLLWCALNFSLTHDADSMKHSLDGLWWLLKHLDLV